MRRFALLCLTLACARAFGQTTKADDPIATVRPSFSDATSIVPVRTLQLESGLTYDARGGVDPQRADFGEVLLRYGLRPRLEARLSLPNENLVRNGPQGLDNTTFGLSYYLGKAGGFDLGVVGALLVPSGTAGLRNRVTSPIAEFNAERGIGGGTSFGGTVLAQYTKDDVRNLLDYQASAYLQQSLDRRTVAFVEYAGFYDRDDLPRNLAHLGVQFLVGRRAQIDLHGGFGLNAAATRGFVGAGYSVRF